MKAAKGGSQPLHDRLDRARRVAFEPVIDEQERGLLQSPRVRRDLDGARPGVLADLLDAVVGLGGQTGGR